MKDVVSTTIRIIDDASRQLETISTEMKKTGKATADNEKELEKIGKELNEAGQDANGFRQQIQMLKEQMAKMLADGVSPTDSAFRQLAQRAGALQDAMGDANTIIRDFASDTNGIDKYTSGIKTLVGAVGIYQSAMSLAGVENEKLEQSMKKLLAVQTMLNSVQEVSNQLQNQSSGIYKLLHANVISYTGASKGAAIATRVLNGALKAMGIGLIVGAVALLSDHWEELVGWFKKSIPELSGLSGLFDKVKAVVFGLGNAIIKMVITPIKGLVKVVQDIKNGEFKKALYDMKDLTVDVLTTGIKFGENLQEGYTQELQNQEDRRTKAAKEAEDERLKKLREAKDERMKLLAEEYAAKRKIEEQNDEFLKQIDEDRNAEKLKNAKDLAKSLYDTNLIKEDDEEDDPTDDKAIEKHEKQQELWRKKQEDLKNLQQTVSSVSDTFGILGDAIGGNAGAMLSWAGDTMSAIGNVLPKIIQLIAAKEGESIATATASGAAVGFPANIAAIATGVASVMASFMKIPKFASGGIAYGPTLGLFGEYSGASNNPEVVAPLDRLKSIIGEQNGVGNVQFKISGRDLVGILNKENTLIKRS